MNIQLAEPIARYFKISNGTDSAGLQQCFAADALVLDEGGNHQGHAAIQAWFLDTRQKYQFQVTPLSTSSNNQQHVVVAEVRGNFPGSPIQLSYTFTLNERNIQSLKIS